MSGGWSDEVHPISTGISTTTGSHLFLGVAERGSVAHVVDPRSQVV